MSPQIRRTPRTLAATAAVALVAMPLTGTAEAAQGTGNPVLSASPATALSASGPTKVTLTGKDFLVPPHAAGTPVSGGVYVFFGWVDTTKKWGPSGRNINNNDGNFGVTYLYPGEGGSADSQDEEAPPSTGFVSFTATNEDGETTSEYHMNDNGDFTIPLTVPGATFTTKLPGGAGTKTTDCRMVKCGFFTIGAHGKVSATNEKFTPVTFAGASPAATPTPKPSGTPRASGSTSVDDDSDPVVSPLPKTGADDVSVVRPGTPIDGDTVAVGVSAAQDNGTGGGLALFGVAALIALVVALAASVVLRFRREDG